MQKADCLFCKIITGEIPSYQIWENDEFLAFLDLFPNCKGQTLVIPKNHLDSDLFLIKNSDFYARYLSALQEVVDLLKTKLKVQRVGMIMEGLGVHHLHIKLYPMRGLDTGWKPNIAEEKVYFPEYPGFLTTKMGNQASQEELSELVKLLKS